VITCFLLEDLEYLAWIEWLYTSFEPPRPYVALYKGFVKGRVEVLEELSLSGASKASGES